MAFPLERSAEKLMAERFSAPITGLMAGIMLRIGALTRFLFRPHLLLALTSPTPPRTLHGKFR